MTCLKTGATHYRAPVLPDKGSAINEFVVYWVLPWVIERVTLQFTSRVYLWWHLEDLCLNRQIPHSMLEGSITHHAIKKLQFLLKMSNEYRN